MSFLYPRAVDIHRQRTVATSTAPIGLTGYSGREQSTNTSDAAGETVVYTGLAANISAKRVGRTRNMMLPGDVFEKSEWLIVLQMGAVPQYGIRDRDIVVDDAGYRYDIGQAEFLASGAYQLTCVRLET